jgi:polar amino acid transport system permease protein
VERADELEEARGERWRAPSPPTDAVGFSTSAVIVAILAIASTWWVIRAVHSVMAESRFESALIEFVLYGFGALSVALVMPALLSVNASLHAREAVAGGDIVAARTRGAAARTWCWYTCGYGAAIGIVLAAALFIIANNVAVGRTFFLLPLIGRTFDLVLKAFGTNVFIFCTAEILVLAWGLVVAIGRLIPGAPGQPVRLIATVYTDVFRGLPAIVTIYLVGFGLPLAGLPVVKDFRPEWYAILALTLTYGAYVAEVYRAGIESIHWSQTAAARSLGLSFFQTLRFVIVPQAVRRIVPPLLNDFIGLQKDTALVAVIGVIDAFNQAKIVASNYFSLSPVTTVAFLFVVITIPQARFVDYLLERDRRRMRASG